MSLVAEELDAALPRGLWSFGRVYCSALESWPLRTKAATSALLFAAGDVVAQLQLFPASESVAPVLARLVLLDKLRLLKYTLTGYGYGVMWSYW